MSGSARATFAADEVVTTAQMRALDRRTIELGTPGATLMERAGRGIAREIATPLRAAARRGVVVVSGTGNNGGDGFVVARLLRGRGLRVAVHVVGDPARIRGDAALHLERWRKTRGRVGEAGDASGLAALRVDLARAGVIVDAIFGTGLNAPVEGPAAAAIAAIDEARRGSAFAAAGRGRAARGTGRAAARPRPVIVAVDLPSGLDGDSGEPWGVAVRADLTVALGARKIGLALPAARPWAGRVVTVDIGLAAAALREIAPPAVAASAAALAPLLPARRASSHKGAHGHLIVVAGSAGKSGAAVLAARAALRGGAGLVTVACPAVVQPLVAVPLPEAMTEGWTGFAPAQWGRRLAGRDAAVLGPGLGTGDDEVALARWLATSADLPVVIDADGLNALAGRLEALRLAPAARILTPHPGEMARLCGRTTAAVQADRLGTARSASAASGAVVVLKGAGTIVAAPDGRAVVNTTGGPILATGGTGDVLAGLVGSLLAQGLAAWDAARLGAFLHGAAGDRLAARLGDAGLLASELADEIPLAREALSTPVAGREMRPPGTAAISRGS